jgi:single-strand DNA-binding protein
MKDLKNRVQLIGNLGMDPEFKKFDDGKKLVKFSLATSQTYYSQKGEKVTDTQWHNIVAWGALAERADKFLKKGSSVMIEGKIVYHTYEDKSGTKKTITEINMNDLVMLSKKE